MGNILKLFLKMKGRMEGRNEWMEGERKKYELNKYIIQVRSDQVHHFKDHSLGHGMSIIKIQDEMLRELRNYLKSKP